ncbi:uncharacterized protein LOC110807679 [Carica papaya]|uniref:uncharacterized protein LOC110807679 n=1 Tax=Carica papaya TaxID=3649 RepID=UPI000B8CE488|nr:uncharacterized protein LOC110807679 [Carica papaya]
MSTKTMRPPPRRVLTPNKRKEREEFDAVRPPAAKAFKPDALRAGFNKAAVVQGPSKNRILAGYLAHEFLTRGTLFGETWDPARVQVAEPRKNMQPSQKAEAEKGDEARERKRQGYVEVAYVMRADGTHLPGIVNPAQLARFLQLP